jgi:glucosamine--fructose-6-phosphate aminotransferase (isomerizing)
MGEMRTVQAHATYREIMAQADTLPTTIKLLAQLELGRSLSGHSHTPVFTGCGTSHYLALAAAATTRSLTGRPAVAVPAGEAWLMPEMTVTTELRPLLVPISRSGATTETVRAAQMAKERGLPVIAITINGGQIAPHSDFVLELSHVQEDSVVTTQSYSNLLLSLHWLAAGLAGTSADRYRAALAEVPGAVAALLPQFDSLARDLASRTFGHYVFLGGGALAGVAFEGMLKMTEMSQIPSEAYHSLEFRHGPISTVTNETLVTIITCPRNLAQDLAIAAEVRRFGGASLVLGPGVTGFDAPEMVIDLPRGFPDWQYGNLAVPMLQLLAYHRTIGAGLNPDSPRNLTHVVQLQDA